MGSMVSAEKDGEVELLEGEERIMNL